MRQKQNEIECDGKPICRSCEETLSCENPNYKCGYKKIITPQMGQSFLFDATKNSDTIVFTVGKIKSFFTLKKNK